MLGQVEVHVTARLSGDAILYVVTQYYATWTLERVCTGIGISGNLPRMRSDTSGRTHII